MELRTPTAVVTVDILCDVCNDIITTQEIIWNSNTKALTDGTISYSYTCQLCNYVILSNTNYPYQEFIKQVT